MSASAADAYAEVTRQQMCDTLTSTEAQRWEWLMEAMQSSWALAQDRAKQGRVTLGPHGELLWSPRQQREWEGQQSRLLGANS